MSRLPYGYKWIFVSIISFLIACFWMRINYFNEEALISRIALFQNASIELAFMIILPVFFIETFVNRKFLDPLETKDELSLFSKGLMIIGSILMPMYFLFGIIYYGGGNLLTYLLEGTDKKFLEKSWQNILWIFGLNFLMPLAIALLPSYLFYRVEKLKENKTFRQLFMEGRGGSARWAGSATYEKHRYTKGGIFLGKSLFDDDPKPRLISVEDDAHMLTIGMTGSGKSTTVLLPNLSEYKGSAIVLDPKGELANNTYRRRSSEEWLAENAVTGNTKIHFPSGAKCYVLDPFSETNNLSLNSYNLLSEIDINSDRAREMLSAIADGCVVSDGGDNAHFEEMARYFIEGVIAHVLSKYPKELHNLPFVFDLIHGIDTELKVADPTKFKELLYIMMKNDAVGGLPQQIASKLLEMGDRERGSVLSTVARSLKWIGDPAMRKHLVNSDFKFSDIGFRQKDLDNLHYSEVRKSGFTTWYINPTTVYIVLPDGLINEQMRWLRTLVSVSIGALRNLPEHKRPKIPTLFIMDEFPRLGGKIKAISEGFGILRGYGIKLWAFIQDIGQIQKDYPDRWNSMMANSTVQVFGVNDINTAEWLSQNLGTAVHRRKDGREGFTKLYKKKVVNEAVYPLLTPNEVMNKFGKTTNRQVVIPTDGLPMRLERLAYKPMNINGNKFRAIGTKGHFEDW